VIILLLNHGKEIFEKVYRRREKFLAEALKRISVEDMRLLLDLLRKLDVAISS